MSNNNENPIFVENYWPTSIMFTDHPNPTLVNDELEKNIYDWMKQDDGIKKSNRGGWHSDVDMHKRKEFTEIRDWITDQVSRVEKELCLVEDSQMIMDNMWANVNRKGDYNQLHTHPKAHISGVYYVRTPSPEQSKIWFYDPRHAYKHHPLNHDSKKIIEERHTNLWAEVHFTPQEGRLILFPAYLEHSVDPNMSDNDRISLSFNFFQGNKIRA